MAISVSNVTLEALEKEIVDYAKSLLDGPKLSQLADAFGKELGVKNQRNVDTIKQSFIKRITEELVVQGAPKNTAKRMASETVKTYSEAVLAKIN